MNTTQTLEQMKQLKLNGMTVSYSAQLELPVHQQLDAHELIAQLVQAELLNRNNERTALYLKLARLRLPAVPEQIACTASRNLTKQQLATLLEGHYIRQAEPVLITGATGCGKSYLACALGYQACIQGYKTLYLNMNRLIEKITLAKLDGSYIKLLNHFEKVPLIILDDFGLQPLNHEVKLALLQILEDRYAKRTVIFTSQLPISKWHEYINEPTLADAILDRLTAKAHRIELKGESLRRKKATA
jgi:DNA replication protein DnaC